MSRSVSGWLLVPLAIASLAASAQDKPDAKKLYCWNDPKSGRTCSDTLPPGQVNGARDEFNVNSGARVGAVDAALTAEQRTDAALAQAQARADQAAQDTRHRTERAMLFSYSSENELRRVFTERTTIVDNSIDTARYNVASMRDGLILKLQLASNAELAGRTVDPKLADDIRQRHIELLHQQALLGNFQQQRIQLDGEVEQTLQRYRALKSAAQPTG